MAVTSTVCGGATEAAIVAGLLGIAVSTVLVGEGTAGEVGAAPGDEDPVGAAGVVGLVGVAAATVVVGENGELANATLVVATRLMAAWRLDGELRSTSFPSSAAADLCRP